MMKRKLMSFVSVTPNPPCFVIPIFSVPGKNLACAQDLDAFGMVKRFCPISTEHFFDVPILAEKLEVELGLAGLLAFWHDLETLYCGTMSELGFKLECVDEECLPAFVAVEAMTLVNDEHRLENAVRRAAPLISDDRLRNSLRERVLSRSRTVANMQKVQLEIEKSKSEELQVLLSDLEKDMLPDDWIKRWRAALNKFGYIDEIKMMAEWKLETGGLLNREGSIILDLLNLWYIPFSNLKFLQAWIQSKVQTDSSWVNVWMIVRDRNFFDIEFMNEFAFSYIENRFVDEQKENEIIDLVFWRRLWRDGFRRSVLIEIVERRISGSRYHDNFMEFVGYELFMSNANVEFLVEEVDAWLEQPKSLNTWVFMLIEFSKRYGADMHRNQAIDWLQRLGRGSNQWIKLWQFFNGRLEELDWIRLGIEWLLTARIDLKSWPKVFALVSDAVSGDVNDALTLAASKWLAANGGKKRNRFIENFARTVESPRLI